MCTYCRAEYASHAEAPARGMHDYAVGDAVLVRWGSSFWDAHVVAKIGERRWKIRYDGYDASSDEVVGPGRIRPRDPEAADQELDEAMLADEGWDADEGAAADAPGATSSTRYPRGSAVDLLWQGRWYDGTVKQVVARERWLVGYDGWSDSWDEVVGTERIRPRTVKPRGMGIVAVATLVAVALALVVVAIVAFRSIAPTTPTAPASEPSVSVGSAVDARSLAVGQRVSVEWQGRWYEASVLEVISPTAVRVHYVGWSSSWDEVVGPARIRLRAR